ncbi:MAG: 2-C-methyl-D-erythritol 4-phosphate cytidylyltransferase [Planctomycetaceae bacterium]|nr:MAG: 2-C-methyl-D-erythritol 4-phosphate cytidylyltransferase [Planctomycetaceae bacterium]
MDAARFGVILPAAGRSARFKQSQPQARKKVFSEIQGRAVWLRAAEVFVNHPQVIQVIVVVAPEDLDEFKHRYQANLALLDIQVVPGGPERSDSVRLGLEKLRSEVNYVAVHDAARPVLANTWIDAVFEASQQHGAAILAVPVSSTLKRVDEHHHILGTVDRQGLWAAQTPQVCRRDWLLDAYARCGSQTTTDEAQLLELAGYSVHVVQGSTLNIKITTAEDLRIAETFLDLLPKPKPSLPLHPFADEDPRWR